ncbi:MAG: cardiolipin synthase [Gemmobacter sp.]
MDSILVVVTLYLVQFGLIARALLREALAPPVRLAWVMVIAALPVVGILAYLLFGEIRVRRAKAQRMREVRHQLIAAWGRDEVLPPLPPAADPAFAAGQATGGMPPVEGNRALLLPEGDAMMDDVIDHIDAARDHVHVLFYIWLPDNTGARMARALIRAARRGVACRVLVDDLGSRALVRSSLWPDMIGAGVNLVRAFPLGNPFIKLLFERMDVRNHRKIVVIDNRVTWCGSRNCADAAFLVKAKYAPWVDVLLRFEGPVVRQNQAVFLQDWMTYQHEDLSALLADAPEAGPEAGEGGFTAQVIASGPDQSLTGLSETMCAMMYGARERLTVTTPYYVPNIALHTALCAAGMRGVEVTLIVPARNDSRIVAAASESLYSGLLESGVRIMAFDDGVIHSKIMTVDGRLTLVGSANVDHRSFDLNYENNILLDCPRTTAELDERQQSYVARAQEITLEDVTGWSIPRRVRNNMVALASPLL